MPANYLDQLYPFHRCLPVSPDANAFFQTIGAAKSVAGYGDIIIVWPGLYNEDDLLKDGVNYFFLPGAHVVSNTDFTIFADHNLPITCHIWGSGTFQISGGASVLDIDHAGSVVTFEGDKVIAANTVGDPVFSTNGTVRITLKSVDISTDGGVFRPSGGTLFANIDTIQGAGATTPDPLAYLAVACFMYLRCQNYNCPTEQINIHLNHALAILTADIQQMDADEGTAIKITNGSAKFNILTLSATVPVLIEGGTLTGFISCPVAFSQSGGTVKVINPYLSGLSSSGTGSPESAVFAAPGALYVDTASDSLWYKKTGTTSTGWVQLIA